MPAFRYSHPRSDMIAYPFVALIRARACKNIEARLEPAVPSLRDLHRFVNLVLVWQYTTNRIFEAFDSQVAVQLHHRPSWCDRFRTIYLNLIIALSLQCHRGQCKNKAEADTRVDSGSACRQDSMNKLTESEHRELMQGARSVAKMAYAPYSKFRVGAAVLGRSGIYFGTNVENASSGLSLCAERSALASAVAAGDRAIRAIAVACIDADPAGGAASFMPCGACRQWIAELAPGASILLVGQDRDYTIEELLPQAFRLS